MNPSDSDQRTERIVAVMQEATRAKATGDRWIAGLLVLLLLGGLGVQWAQYQEALNMRHERREAQARLLAAIQAAGADTADVRWLALHAEWAQGRIPAHLMPAMPLTLQALLPTPHSLTAAPVPQPDA